jgi:hypothetical protein
MVRISDDGVAVEKGLGSLMEKTKPFVTKCLKKRFSTFDLPLFKSFHWLYPSTWTDDHEELQQLKDVACHFKTCLEASGFKLDDLKREWVGIKRLVAHKYQRQLKDPLKLWKTLLNFHKIQFTNCCLLAEVVLSVGVSNSMVESGFSRLTHLLSDRRLSMSHDTMEDMLLIQTNNNILPYHKKCCTVQLVIQGDHLSKVIFF